jgi:hypothetical protein
MAFSIRDDGKYIDTFLFDKPVTIGITCQDEFHQTYNVVVHLGLNAESNAPLLRISPEGGQDFRYRVMIKDHRLILVKENGEKNGNR